MKAFETVTECQCPDDQVTQQNGTCQLNGGECTQDQWQCGNMLCIPSVCRCDEDNDCGVGSDELACREEVCDLKKEILGRLFRVGVKLKMGMRSSQMVVIR